MVSSLGFDRGCVFRTKLETGSECREMRSTHIHVHYEANVGKESLQNISMTYRVFENVKTSCHGQINLVCIIYLYKRLQGFGKWYNELKIYFSAVKNWEFFNYNKIINYKRMCMYKL